MTVDRADWPALSLTDGRVLRLAGIESFALITGDSGATEPPLQQRLAALAATQPVSAQLLSQEPDRYGRLPSLLWSATDGVQETLLREGLALAWAAGEPLPCFDRMLAAEDEARRAGAGFWAGRQVPPARAAALAPLVGRFVIFEGTVLTVGNRPSTTYLNFGTWWMEDVTAEVAERDRESFGGEGFLTGLAGERVRLRGFLEEKAGPMLRLRWPTQLESLGPAAVADGGKP